MSPDLHDHLNKRSLSYREGVFYLSRESDAFAAQEKIYLRMREKEGRLYPDDVLMRLPDVDPGHPLAREWRIRKTSMERLMTYLGRRSHATRLLDLGCGSGWMARHLAGLPDCHVFALDLNRPELAQGARVFSDCPRLCFIYGNIFEDIFPAPCFDIIVMAGSIQYFPDAAALINRLSGHLDRGGEIHIVDSPFYSERTAAAARERTKRHYLDLGFPDMAAHYHHHLFSSLAPFGPVLMYNPKAPVQRVRRRLLSRGLSPFPWIRIAVR
jgi:SAM-dependent methyltransferase